VAGSGAGILAGARELWHRPSGQLPGLDGLRAIAVLFVVCDHWVFEWLQHEHRAPLWFFKLPMFHWGWTGVDLFFVLSGFLIGQQLWRELQRTGRIGFWRFFMRRGLRIWPLYFVWLTFLLVVSTKHRPTWPDWTMLTNYWMTLYGRSWSLATEEQFYLVTPLLLMALGRFLPGPRRHVVVLVALLACVAIARDSARDALVARGITGNDLSIALYAPFHLHCEALIVGLLIAWVSVHRPAWLSPAARGRLPWRPLAAAAGMAALGGALRAVDREVFAYTALGLVYGGALVVALTDQSWLTAPLRSRVFYPIARLSYGMYLNHLVIPGDAALAVAVGTAVAGAAGAPVFLISLVVVMLVSAAVAAITFVLVEQPGLRLRDQLLGHTHAPRAQPATSAGQQAPAVS
jgi:peptidoglycan/LPS O-acetylase OafA/YrhL